MLTTCPHEKEVREFMARGQWPDACAPELRTHISGCRSCGDLVLVAEAFRNARAESVAAARPVSPTVLMWRAQLRKRDAAMARVARPLLGAQIFACAVTIVAALGFAGFELRSGADWLTWDYWHDWLTGLPQAAVSQWNSISSGSATGAGWEWLALVSAAMLLLGGVAVYFATDKQ